MWLLTNAQFNNSGEENKKTLQRAFKQPFMSFLPQPILNKKSLNFQHPNLQTSTKLLCIINLI